jgi:hypothetical protein
MEQLMSGKLTTQDWIARCKALGIGQLMLGPAAQRQLDLLDPTAAS